MGSSARGRTGRHICIFGLTAAGKTTHAKLLAQQLDCDYVSASQLMFDELGYRDPGDHGTWVRSASEISTKREDGSVDREVNRKLLALARGTSRIVFDSWTLPFMVRETSDLRQEVIFLRLDSDVRSRAVKSLVSLGAGAELGMPEATRLISEKDAASRQIFVRIFGFDIFRPADYFGPDEQLIIDVGAFVYGVSADQVRKGVRDAHQCIMLRIAEWPGGL
jgi:cytidylate kinase